MAKISINQDSLKPKREWKRHKVKEGSNIFRFLPPFGEESNGYPYRKWMVIWGLNDPESGRMRPYASPITTAEKACPVMEYVDALKKKVEDKKAQLQAAGTSDSEIKEQLKPLNKVISNLRPKTVYAWNAVDKAGTLGLLEVKPTAQKEIKDLMRAYIKDYNQDPTSVNSETDDSGVWFDVQRSGTGFDTEYKVKKVQSATKVNGVLSYVDDRSALPDNIVENWEDQAYDLSSIYQVKSYNELREIFLANLANVLKDCPEAAVPGFDPTTAATQSDVAQASVQAAPTAKGNGSVNLNLGADDDEEDTVVKATASAPTPVAAAPAPAPKTVVANAPADSDDIFAMADSILDD